ncbi:hypothetical protein OIU76_016310 [Salix suchowensis]|nr:hypothetical protein OIU76_016310 [Salix suchowensis]
MKKPASSNKRINQIIYRNSTSSGRGGTFRMHEFIPLFLPNPSIRQKVSTLHTFITSAFSCEVSLGLN